MNKIRQQKKENGIKLCASTFTFTLAVEYCVVASFQIHLILHRISVLQLAVELSLQMKRLLPLLLQKPQNLVHPK